MLWKHFRHVSPRLTHIHLSWASLPLSQVSSQLDGDRGSSVRRQLKTETLINCSHPAATIADAIKPTYRHANSVTIVFGLSQAINFVPISETGV